MIANVLRDSVKLPVGAGLRALQSNAADALAPPRPPRQSKRLKGVLAVATHFETWRILANADLESDGAAAAMADLLRPS